MEESGVFDLPALDGIVRHAVRGAALLRAIETPHAPWMAAEDKGCS